MSEITQESKPKISNALYEKTLRELQIELVNLQEWIKAKGLRVVVLFEGRDAAGKGGTIKRITECLNPRICKVVALSKPTEREETQWYFQRYVAHLPAAGELMLFDRSWYNRAGVDKVMGFCTNEEYEDFLRSCPSFENMLIRSGIILIKYWFSVSDTEQERRFQSRINDPTRRWKISPMDLESRKRWVEYSQAKDTMFSYTDTKISPWFVVHSDNKKMARLNCIAHLLSMIKYEPIERQIIVLPPKEDNKGYVRPPVEEQTFVPDFTGDLLKKIAEEAARENAGKTETPDAVVEDSIKAIDSSKATDSSMATGLSKATASSKATGLSKATTSSKATEKNADKANGKNSGEKKAPPAHEDTPPIEAPSANEDAPEIKEPSKNSTSAKKVTTKKDSTSDKHKKKAKKG